MLRSQVEVAQATASGRHDLADGSRRGSIAHVDHVRQPRQGRRRLVGPGLVSIRAGAEVCVPGARETKSLPHGPQTIHLAVVDPEGRVTGRGEEISTGVAADGVVDAAVRADLGGVGHALGDDAVLVDVGLGQQSQDGGVVGVAHVESRADVALEAARVITEAAEGARGGVGQAADGAEVHRHVGEGARLDEAAADAGSQGDVVAADAGGRHDDGAVVRDVLAVAAQAVGVAVEDGRVLGRGRVLGPVPVGLVASVAALVAQGQLVLVDEPAVPRLEDARVVDRERLLDVRDDEVIKPRPSAGGDAGGGARGKALQALDGVDVGETLGLGEGAAEGMLISVTLPPDRQWTLTTRDGRRGCSGCRWVSRRACASSRRRRSHR